MSNLKVKRIADLEGSNAIAWLIDGLWRSQGVGIVAAEPKCGKTWLALDIAVSLASGMPCLGQYAVAEPRKVLFYNGEDSESIQGSRLGEILKAKGIDGELPNLGVITATSLKLNQDADVNELRRIVNAERPALLILDPFVRMHNINENNSAAVADLLSKLRLIQKDFGTAIILVHHAAKGKSKNARGGTKMRGSGELHAWGDSNLYLSKQRSGETVMDIEHRASESVIDVPLELAKVNGGTCLRIKDSSTEVEDVTEAEVQSAIPEQRLHVYEAARSPSLDELDDEELFATLKRQYAPIPTSQALTLMGWPLIRTTRALSRLTDSGRVNKGSNGYAVA